MFICFKLNVRRFQLGSADVAVLRLWGQGPQDPRRAGPRESGRGRVLPALGVAPGTCLTPRGSEHTRSEFEHSGRPRRGELRAGVDTACRTPGRLGLRARCSRGVRSVLLQREFGPSKCRALPFILQGYHMEPFHSEVEIIYICVCWFAASIGDVSVTCLLWNFTLKSR